jgi:hypothetical protein
MGLSESSFRFWRCGLVAHRPNFLRFLGLPYSEILERKLSFSIMKRAAAASTKQRSIVDRRRFNPHDPVFRFTVGALEFGRHGLLPAAEAFGPLTGGVGRVLLLAAIQQHLQPNEQDEVVAVGKSWEVGSPRQ